MATVVNQLEILLGGAVSSQTVYEVIPTGSTGTPGALRTLTHPDPLSPIVTYFCNPDRTTNFLSVPLKVPTHRTVQTLSTTLPFIDPRNISDVMVTETWNASDNRAKIPASFLKLLFELIINRPDSGQFVVWDPRDLVTDGTKYNITQLDLRVGGSSLTLDASERWVDQVTGIDVVTTGLVDRTVEHEFLIRSAIAP